MDLLEWLIHGTIPVPGGGELGAREVIGNVFGLASAILGMQRLVWAWPVGLIGNVLLFTVFATGELLRPDRRKPLWGQAGRQVFFAAVSPLRLVALDPAAPHGGASDGGAIAPRWATGAERVQLLVLGVVGYAAAYVLLTQVLGSWGPVTEAWILTGSMLATYGMARGWVEFWLVWVLVDIVGVTDAGAGRLLPDRRHVPRLRRVRGHRVLRVACGPAGTVVDTTGTPTAAPRRCRHERAPTACASTPSSRPSPTSPPARPSSWWTTRTARTRATSSSPPRRRPPS